MASKARVKLRKVKTGCYTCKARRVKCDEEKPFCRRCINAGRKCEGYYSTASLNSERRADPPTALSLLPNCSDRERRYFHLYHARTIDSICAFFGSYFWSTLVPQVSIREPSVQHALLALTALHESVATAGRPDLVGLRLDPSNVFAVVHYNKAIAHLTAPEQRHSTDTVLLCCIIFVCIELVRNNTRAALDHIHAGLRLLQDARSRESSSPPRICISTHPSNIRESLDTTFARLDIQSMFLGATPQLTLSHPNSTHPNATAPSTPTGIPSNFPSLPEARAYLETLSGIAFHFMRTHPEPQYGVALTPEAATEHESILARMRAWADAFEPLFERSKSCSTSIRRTAHILKLQQASAYVWIASHTRKSETEYDNFTPQFAEVVRLSSSIVLEGGASSSSTTPYFQKGESFKQPEFAFDFGAMAALHFTSMKCRVPRIRHEALRLLILSPRQEGVFNREFVGKISAYAIQVEEAAAAKRDAAPSHPSSEADREALKNALAQAEEEEMQNSASIMGQDKQHPIHDQSSRRPSSEASFSQSMKTADSSSEAFDIQPLSAVYGEPKDAIEVLTRQQELLEQRAWNQAMHENQASADIVAGAVAQRASGGRIVEINERIMGYDVDSESYSFDVRNFE